MKNTVQRNASALFDKKHFGEDILNLRKNGDRKISSRDDAVYYLSLAGIDMTTGCLSNYEQGKTGMTVSVFASYIYYLTLGDHDKFVSCVGEFLWSALDKKTINSNLRRPVKARVYVSDDNKSLKINDISEDKLKEIMKILES